MTGGPLPSVSVVICCYNSSTRLPDALKRLRAQQGTKTLTWEILVVDNASTDGSAELAASLWPTGEPAQLRVVYEPRLGLSHARRRGLENARYDIISFVDDDNWVGPEWILRTAQLFATESEVGACGGQAIAVFEGDEPSWFKDFSGCFAVGQQCNRRGYLPRGKLLWGAGLSLRRTALAALYEAGFPQLNHGRVGSALLASEDHEICAAIRLAGWKLFYDPTLRFEHMMPVSRMTWPYLLRLVEGAGRGTVAVKHYTVALTIRQGSIWSGAAVLHRCWSVELASAVCSLVWEVGAHLPARRWRHAEVTLRTRWGKLHEILRSRSRFIAGARAVAAFARNLDARRRLDAQIPIGPRHSSGRA